MQKKSESTDDELMVSEAPYVVESLQRQSYPDQPHAGPKKTIFTEHHL